MNSCRGVVVVLLGLGVGAPFLRPGIEDNERAAVTALKALTTAQADFRANDRDKNGINDFWTGDVASFHSLEVDGQPLRLIGKAIADADASRPNPIPYHGYLFKVLEGDDSEADPKLREYRQDTGGRNSRGKVYNHSKFGFVAYPARHGRDGKFFYVVNENNTIYRRDALKEAPWTRWPKDEVLKGYWGKID